MITLRDYQQTSVDKVYKLWNMGIKNCLLVEPTGAGKTFIKSQFARDAILRKEVVIIFAHRDVLLSQISDSLCQMGVTHSFIAANKTVLEITNANHAEYGDSFHSQTSKIILASVPTFIRRLDKGLLEHFLPVVKVWMLDEAHHCLKNNMWGKCVTAFPNAIGLGVTATPTRSDKLGLGREFDGVFDHMIVGSTMGELIQNGYLSPYKIFVPPQKLDVSGINITASGDYNQKKLAERTDTADITGDAVEQYLKLASGEQAITFCVNIAHAENVAKEFNKAGIPSVALSSKTSVSKRVKSLKDFERGVIKNLVNCDLFGEGYDCPKVACVIMLRKTDSYGLFKQQFGRLLRVVEGKSYGVLIDHVGNVKKHCIYGAPHEDPEWTLRRTKKKSGDDTKPSGRICPECFAFYTPSVLSRFVCKECNHEETTQQTNEEMRKFIVDKSDLVEMNIDFIDSLLKQRDKVDLNPAKLRQDMNRANMRSIQVDSAVNNHTKRQFAQNRLRAEIQKWCSVTAFNNDWDAKTTQMYFEKTFKINILKAQVLSERLSLELLEKINYERL